MQFHLEIYINTIYFIFHLGTMFVIALISSFKIIKEIMFMFSYQEMNKNVYIFLKGPFIERNFVDSIVNEKPKF